MRFEPQHITYPSGDRARTLLIIDSGVPGVDKAVAAFREAHAAYAVKAREVDAQYTVVGRLSDTSAAEARAAGKKVDVKKIRAKAVAEREKLEDLTLEREGLSTELASAHADYINALGHFAPALVAEARAVIETKMLDLATARKLAADAATAFEAATVVLTGLHGVGDGRAEPANVRTAQDDLSDGAGHPGIFASLADEPIVKAIGYAQRHLDWQINYEREQAALVEANRLEAERVAEFDRIEAERVAAEQATEVERIASDPEAAKAARKAAKARAKAEHDAALAEYHFATE